MKGLIVSVSDVSEKDKPTNKSSSKGEFTWKLEHAATTLSDRQIFLQVGMWLSTYLPTLNVGWLDLWNFTSHLEILENQIYFQKLCKPDARFEQLRTFHHDFVLVVVKYDNLHQHVYASQNFQPKSKSMCGSRIKKRSIPMKNSNFTFSPKYLIVPATNSHYIYQPL